MMEAMRDAGAGPLGRRLRVGQRLPRRSRTHRVPQRGVRDQLAGEPAARRPLAEHGEVRGRDRRDGGAHARWCRRRVRHRQLGRHREHPARDEGVPRPCVRRAASNSPEMIVPSTAHAAFDKAADYFRIDQGDGAGRARRPRRRRRDRSRDHAEHRRDRRLGAVLPERPRRPDRGARRSSRGTRDIGFHTDACLGGFVLPWAERLGYAGAAVRLPRAGRDLDVGRHAQVRLRGQGHVGRALPRQGAAPLPVLPRPRTGPAGSTSRRRSPDRDRAR